MNKKLFVGNISWNLTDEDLRAVFEKVGVVEEAVIVMDKIKNRSRGFGFVTMSTPEEAAKAVEEIDQEEVDGRALTVSEAIEKNDRNDRRDRRSDDSMDA